MNQEMSDLEEKQQYLRTNVNQNQYEEFYEFCQNNIGSVDVNGWTLSNIQQIINKYNVYRKEKQQAEGTNEHEASYNQYQSAQVGKKIENQYNNQDMDDCRSSRIVKSSAVDLLDEAFQTSSVSSAKFTTQNNQNQRSNTMKFDDFDFWSSTMSPKEQGRQKSMTQHFNNNGGSSTPAHVPKYDPRYSSKNRYSMSQQYPEWSEGGGMDLFVPPPEHKKTSPYMKKQSYTINQANNKPSFDNQYGMMELKKPQNKTNSSNIQKNTISKIKIKEITQINDPNKHTIRAQSQNHQKNAIKQTGTSSRIIETGNTENNNKWILQQKAFTQNIRCFKSTIRNQLSSPNLNVLIDEKFQIIQRSFLASNYPMYTLKVVPLNIQCKRNYDDFSKLKKNLQKFFPGVHLAYLEDGSWFNGTDNDYIERQKRMIEMFMRDLLRNRQVRNSRVMEDFLTLTEHKSIKRKFQKYEKMTELQGIQQLCLLDGQVTVTISSEQKNYLTHLNRFIYRMDDLYQKHRKLTDSVSKQYSQLMDTFNNLVKLMTEIQKQIKAFNSKVTINQLKHLGNTYRVIRQTYKEDLSSLKFEHEVNIKKVTPFLKYEHENMLQLKKLLDIQQKFHKLYNKRTIQQKIDPSENYSSEKARIGKKGIMEQSKNILVLKYQVGYFGNQARLEGQRLFNQMGYKMLKKWQNISESYLDRFTKNIEYRKKLSRLDCEKYLPVLAS